MNLGIIGTGNMGGTLGKLWAAKGHRVFFGSRDPKKAAELAKAAGHNAKAGTYQQAVQFGDAILLATPWPSTEETVKSLGALGNKILIDCTNPLLPDFSGLAVGHTTSGSELISQWARGARVIKAFNSIFAGNIAQPRFSGQSADIFFCGDDEAAKTVVAQLIRDIELEPVYCGPLTQARLLEPLAFLWVYLAFNQNRQNTAWKLLPR